MVWNGGKGKKEGAFYFQCFFFFGHVLLGIMIVALLLLFLPVFFFGSFWKGMGTAMDGMEAVLVIVGDVA